MTLPIYTTGTVSVTHLGTTVTGSGGMWSGINAREGDFFVRADGTAVITEVTDAATLQITPWPGATVTGGNYAIQQNYVGRVVGVAAAEDVGVMLEKLHTDGLPFIVGADETVPDPSYGDEGQLAFQPTTGKWWVKSGGVWVPSTGLGGGSPPSSIPPLMDGAAASGSAIPYSREDHVHPSDTSRAPLASPLFTGDPKAPTPTAGDSDTSIATTAFVAAAVALASSRHFITPDDFGGVGDGLTNDTAALQAAMADPRPLFIPAGKNYLFGAAATYTGGGTKLVFGSGASSVLTMTNATQDGLVKNAGGTNLIVRDLQLTTNIAKTAGAAVRCMGSGFVAGQDVLENCKVWAQTATPLFRGISIESDVIPTIRGNYILSCAESGVILNNSISGGGGEAIITGNTFNTTLATGNNAAAIRYQSGQGSIRISDNIVQSYDCGVFIQAQTSVSMSAVIITGNSFEQHHSFSIGLSPAGSAAITNVVITGNSFLNMVGQCLAVFGTSTWINAMTITGNTVLFGVDYAFNVQAGVNLLFANNNLQSYGGATVGILMAAAYPTAALIEGNVFYPANATSINLGGNPGVRTVGNPGYNPLGSVVPTPGASPWAYSSGATPETFFITATGGINGANMGGIDLAFSVGANIPVSLFMNPRETVTVTFTGTLYPRVYKH